MNSQSQSLPSLDDSQQSNLGNKVEASRQNTPSTMSIERSTRGIIVLGISIVAALLLAIGGWAALAPLSSGIFATGVIIADGERSPVQHLGGGIIKKILVQEGEYVTVGQALIQLDDVQTRAKLELLRAAYDGFIVRNARLQAEQMGLDQISFPPELLRRVSDSRVKDIIDAETLLFNERRASLKTSMDIIAQRRALYGKLIAGSEAQGAAMAIQVSIIRDELTGLDELFSNGYVTKTRLLALRREAARLDGEIGAKAAEVAQANVRITEANVSETQSNTEFRKEIMTEKREVQDRIFNLEEQIAATRDTLERLDIRAPKDGSVLGLKFHAVNSVVQPGDSVLDIVPKGQSLIIEAKVRPTDIDNVSVESDTEITFPAFRQRTTPTIMGVVTTVAADTQVEAHTNLPYYTARIAVSDLERQRLHGKPLVVGMPVDVMIKAEDRTLLEILLEPLTDVLSRSFKQ